MNRSFAVSCAHNFFRLDRVMQFHENRLISLDAFRGLTIAAMILVNSPGTYSAVYTQLKHAEWNGCTCTDVVFPCFLFIMGVSMSFSFAARRVKNCPESTIRKLVLRRTLILFALGLFLNTYPIFHLSTLRIPGVLQRIAICYLAASFITLGAVLRKQVYWLLGLLASYWLVMRFFPVPGVGMGVLEPGRTFAAYIDSLLLSGHMWAHYETWDPEGLFSTLPAVATTLFGVLTGTWLRSSSLPNGKATLMALSGTALMLLGFILDPWMPINKNIWTSTFSIFTAGIAMTGFALFYWIIEIKGYKRWAAVFVALGMNSITLYFLSDIIDTTLRFIWLKFPNGTSRSLRGYIYRTCFAPSYASPENASLLFAIAFLLLMLLIAWIMWRKRIFIRI